MANNGPAGINLGKAPAGYNQVVTPNFTPQQMQLFQSLLGGAGNQQPGIQAGLNRLGGLAGGSDEGFEQREAPYYADFQRGLGQLASRFSGAGARNSSAFRNAATNQAGEFAQGLGAQREQLQNNSLMQLLGLSNGLLQQKPYDVNYFAKPKKSNWLNALFGGGNYGEGGAVGGIANLLGGGGGGGGGGASAGLGALAKLFGG